MKKYSKIILTATVLFLLAAGCNKTADQSLQNVVITTITPTPVPAEIKVVEYLPDFSLVGKNYTVKNGSTAMDLLKLDHKIEIQNNKGKDSIVVAIDGKKVDKNHFWLFLVNGGYADANADKYILQDGDSVVWSIQIVGSME